MLIWDYKKTIFKKKNDRLVFFKKNKNKKGIKHNPYPPEKVIAKTADFNIK